MSIDELPESVKEILETLKATEIFTQRLADEMSRELSLPSPTTKQATTNDQKSDQGISR